MKRNLLLAILLLVGSCVLRADELPWQFEYDKALEAAKTQHQPVLLDFTASWCGPCRMMDTTTFANPEVQNALKNYLLVKVDFDRNPALVGKYGVHAIPACIVLNQFGEKVSENVGYLDAKGFNAWLDKNEYGAYAKVSRQQAVADRMKALSQNLEANDAEARDKSIAALLEVYCVKDADADNGSGAKLAEAGLRGFVQRHPAVAAANYLNDRRLAVRILIAALLSEKSGAGVPFDPWEKSDVRVSAVGQVAKSFEILK